MSAVKFVAELEGVREVSLTGTAELEYWRRQLTPAGLVPLEREGQAQVLIVAADATFRGLRFQEMSFSVLAARSDDVGTHGALLVQAFNSRRFFAFCERWWFKTPYHFGQVSLSVNLPLSLSLAIGDQTVLAASMHVPVNDLAIASACVDWPIYLPRHGGKRARKFFARIRGETVFFPFQSGLDSWSLVSSPRANVLAQLLDSGFAPREWIVRYNAYHAKSKTYRDERPIKR